MSGAPPKVQEDISKLRDSRMPLSDTMSLQRQRRSLYVTIMTEAWHDAGISLDDPGEVDQYYLPDEGLVVIDLNDSDNDE